MDFDSDLDNYNKAIVSMFNEIKSIPEHLTPEQKFQQFLDNCIFKPPQLSEETRTNITQILEELKQKEKHFPDPIQDSAYVSVEEIPRDQLQKDIERVFGDFYEHICQEKDFVFMFPSRSDELQIFDEKSERMVLKKGPNTKLSWKESKRALLMYYALEEVYRYCKSGMCFFKRDFYDTHKALFKNQNEADSVLEDVALFLECTMGSIGLCSDTRERIIGDLELIFKDGVEVNCASFNIDGHSLPRGMDQLASIRIKSALFVLLVEREDVFMKLAQYKFHETFRCILVTAKGLGLGDITTRLLLRRIQKDLTLPIIGLTDFSPRGLEKLSVYRHGSKNLSFDCRSLVIPNIRWIGILSGDKGAFGIPDYCLMDMSATSIKKGICLAKSDCMKRNQEWCKELEKMNADMKKIEIEALGSIDYDHLVHKFLPTKLLSKGWL